MRDFVAFLLALWKEWKVLLTGGSLIAIREIATQVFHKPVPPSITWLIFSLTLIIAAFLSWQKQWLQVKRDHEGHFEEIDLKELCQTIVGRTEVQANVFVRPYLGKRVRITGVLSDVRESGDRSLISLLVGDSWDRIHVIATGVSRSQVTSFIPLPAGTHVTIGGTISSVSASSVRIENCELIQAHPAIMSLADQAQSTADS